MLGETREGVQRRDVDERAEEEGSENESEILPAEDEPEVVEDEEVECFPVRSDNQVFVRQLRSRRITHMNRIN